MINEHVRVIVTNMESYTGTVKEVTDQYVYIYGDNKRHYYVAWSNLVVVTLLDKRG